ncbi:MAG: energy transducer TonB [candidate division KSB1 bacterium]|nr:energy transducer TonB [candidate division KSB1 bacterium]MDQ7062893.1 energy transducer TonB [candidate division KSB1 bacterium]
MRVQKVRHDPLKENYPKARELGLVASLCINILFLQVFRTELRTEFSVEPIELQIEVEEIPPTEQVHRPPPPARPAVPIPTESEDVPEDETIEPTEFDLSEIPPPPGPPPEEWSEEVPMFVPYDEPPQIIGGMAALRKALVYPEIAKKAGVEGMVVIAVLVDEKGRPLKTKVMKAHGGNVGFEQAAIDALMKMKWKPAMQRDKPVKVWVSIPVHFKLK